MCVLINISNIKQIGRNSNAHQVPSLETSYKREKHVNHKMLNSKSQTW